MKRKRMNDDYWPPRPGSWEEAVDPYEVQWSRAGVRADERASRDVAVGALKDQRSRPNVPAAV